jgi:hypothetical protein
MARERFRFTGLTYHELPTIAIKPLTKSNLYIMFLFVFSAFLGRYLFVELLFRGYRKAKLPVGPVILARAKTKSHLGLEISVSHSAKSAP